MKKAFFNLLVIVLGLVFSTSVEAATYYVSNSTANGWAMGDDSRSTAQAVSTSTPWLTINGAQNKAANGDTIIVNDGTYTENSGSGYLNIQKNLTINPYVDLGVTIKATSTSRVLNISTAGAVTLGALILDGEGGRDYGMNVGALTALNLNATKIIGNKQVAILNADAVNDMTLTNVQITATTTSLGGYYDSGTRTGGSITVSGGSITIDNLTSGSGAGFLYIGASNGPTVSIDGMTINLTGSGSGYQGIRVANVNNATITDNTVTLTNGSAGCEGILVYASSGSTNANSPTITGNTINHNCTNGHMIIHGTDGASAADNRHNDAVISGNTLTGSSSSTTLHGIMLGSNTGGLVWGNTVRKANIGLLAKLNSGGLFTGNEVYQVNGTPGYGLRSKGSTGTEFTNNGVYITTSYNAYGMYADESGSTPSTGIVYRNNNIYADVASSQFAIVANTNASNAATFSGNNYYTTQSLASNQWNYQGTNYGTLAAWVAARESTATSTNPDFLNLSTSFEIDSDSPLYHAGQTATSTAKDYNGNSFNNPATIGPYELTPSAPTASPLADNFDSAQSVTLRTYGGDEIRYTTDGTTPTCSTGTVYSGAISVPSTTTIKAISCDTRDQGSSVASFAYVISGSSASNTNTLSGGYRRAPMTPAPEKNSVSATSIDSGVVQILFSILGPKTTPDTSMAVPGSNVLVLDRNLSVGSVGSDVRQLQEFLIRQNRGPAAQKLADWGATGNFQSLTRAALAEFQTAVGIEPASGFCGPITRAVLAKGV